jgi:hypothetical protein
VRVGVTVFSAYCKPEINNGDDGSSGMGIPPFLISDLSMVLKRSLIFAFSSSAPVEKGTLVVDTSRKSRPSEVPTEIMGERKDF